MFKTFIPENPDLNETFGAKNLLEIEDTGGDNGIIARAPRVYGDYSGDYSLDPDRIGSIFCLLSEFGYLVSRSRCQIIYNILRFMMTDFDFFSKKKLQNIYPPIQSR